MSEQCSIFEEDGYGSSRASRPINGQSRSGVPFSNQTTSKEAAHSIEKDLPHLERVVFLAIKGHGGLTSDEAEHITQLPHTTCSARIRGLVLRGRIRDSGEKRKTASGRRAAVWVVA